MPSFFKQCKSAQKIKSYYDLMQPATDMKSKITPLISKGKVKFKMTFDDQFSALVLYHLEEYSSGNHLIQALKEDDFARHVVAPEQGIGKSAFFEAINSRGLEQLLEMLQLLQAEASKLLPKKFSYLGDLVAVDGSLIDACMSMYWADYRKGSKKAKIHVGYDINRGIPTKIHLTDGKADERPFVGKIIEPGQTSVLDRYYQCHKNFDTWQEQNKHFVCRIQARTTKQIIKHHEIKAESIIFYDATVKLGSQAKNQTKKPVRVVAYKIDGKDYWIATDRFDLTAEEIAQIYKLRWDIGVSSQGQITQSVKVRPRTKGSNLVAWEVPWRESKAVKPSDTISTIGGYATLQAAT